MSLGRVWGYDTETINGFPYSFQLSHGKNERIYYVCKSRNPLEFRGVLVRTIDRCAKDNDVFLSYNLYFENAVFFRDQLHLFRENRLGGYRVGNCIVSGILEDPTPFLSFKYPDKTVWIIDAAKYFGGDEYKTLEEVSSQFSAVKKLKRPEYLGKRAPKTLTEKKYFEEYSMTDAIACSDLGLGGIIKKYHETAEAEKWCFSLAHLAGDFFNRKFTHGKKLDLAPGNIEGGAYWARFGGYRRGWVPAGIYRDFCHLDLKSAYPFAYSNMRAYLGGFYVRTNKIPRDGEAIVKINTVLPKEDIRPLFQKREKNGKIGIQPLNKVIQFWTTGHEILAYKKVWSHWKYAILGCYEWVGPNKYRPLNAWAKYAFGIKNSAPFKNHWQYQWGKGLANHLTGKFDSSIKYGTEIWSTPHGDLELSEQRPGSLRNFVVAALIRGAVRARVWHDSRYGQQFPPEPSISEMTDSIDIPAKNLKYFKLGKKLGDWELQNRGDLVFYRTGTYQYWYEGKCQAEGHSGIQWRNAENKFSAVGFLKFLLKGGGSYTRKKMIRVREALKMDGGIGKKALTFYDKGFNFELPKKFLEELRQWAKGKKFKD